MWNPAALGYLAEFTFALVLVFCLLLPPRRQQASRRPPATALFLALTLLCLAGTIFVSLLRARLGGFFDTYAMPWAGPRSLEVLMMPWVSVTSGAAAFSFVQFAYRFPSSLPGAQAERRIVGGAMLSLVGLEGAIAAFSNWRGLHTQIWFRPDFLTLWMGLGVAWAGVVFLRQFMVALGDRHSIGAWLIRANLPPAASAARAYLILLLLPLAHVSLLMLGPRLLFETMPLDFIGCWTVLAFLTGFSLIFFNHQAEQSGFMLKFVVVSLALTLAVVITIGWLISPAFVDDFHPNTSVTEGQTLRFAPDDMGGYLAGVVPFAPAPKAGVAIEIKDGRVALPFDFGFYGRSYRTIFVGRDGAVGFTRRPDWIDATIGYGTQPAIYPLAMTLTEPAGSGITATRQADQVVVNWKAGCGARPSLPDCRFQLVLHANGTLDMSYLELPSGFSYRLFEPRAAPWFIGITSGRGPEARPVNLTSGQPTRGSPSGALIQDNYLAFLHHLNRIYAPLTWLMLAATVVVSVTLPTFFRLNLLLPMHALLDGIERFQAGDFDARVPATHNDEIGSLTRTFNKMAGGLQTLVVRLEEQVAERVEDVSRLAAKAAMLEERSRLAAELHDTVSQNLFSASLLSSALSAQVRSGASIDLEIVEQIQSLNRHTLQELRLLMTDLQAHQLTQSPLSALLSDLAQDFGVSNGIELEQKIEEKCTLPSQVQLTFYRIAQEALSNIVRHANASRTTLRFEGTPSRALLSIVDNGCGFDTHKVPAGHLGLQIMTYRANLVGAELAITTRPGEGSAITLRWRNASH